MSTAIEIARELMRLAYAEPQPEQLDHLRLQKLLYYAQGWALVALGRPIFRDPIEAWDNGPVVRDVWMTFTGNGRQPIAFDPQTPATSLSPAERALLEAVWREFRGQSGLGLMDKTHQEPPWKDAHTSPKCNTEITHEALAAYFRPELESHEIPGIPVAEVYRAIDEIGRGGGRPASEVFARLRSRQLQ